MEEHLDFPGRDELANRGGNVLCFFSSYFVRPPDRFPFSDALALQKRPVLPWRRIDRFEAGATAKTFVGSRNRNVGLHLPVGP